MKEQHDRGSKHERETSSFGFNARAEEFVPVTSKGVLFILRLVLTSTLSRTHFC